MDQTLKEQLVSAMYRLKKVGMAFPQDFDIRMEELFIMKRIEQGQHDPDKKINVSELQTNLHITKPAVSQMLNALEKKGFVCRTIDQTDRRKIEVTLTPSGQKILERTKHHADEMLGKTIARFGEENTRELIRLFGLMADITEDLKQETLDQVKAEEPND